MTVELIHSDCLEAMRKMPEASVDAVVCDPPYHLTQSSRGGSPRQNDPATPHGRTRLGSAGFMGKTWDGGDIAFRPETWVEVLRVMKPGAHLLAFGGTRTYHRLACAIEDAGFEIRDSLAWIHAQGFPKSLDVSKAIDRAAGADREVVGVTRGKGGENLNQLSRDGNDADDAKSCGAYGHGAKQIDIDIPITAPSTDAAKQWDGWGTALKPSFEPIVLARKPFDGPVAANVIAHGTGALNIDACRIELNGDYKCKANGRPSQTGLGDNYDPEAANEPDMQGRWPANVCLSHDSACKCIGKKSVKSNGHHPSSRGVGGLGTSGHSGQIGLQERKAETEEIESWECHPDCAVRALDEQAGVRSSGKPSGIVNRDGDRKCYGEYGGGIPVTGFGDSGNASRFFFCSKASQSDRGEGNNHPTVKSTSLCQWLARLITPPGGTILDPFCGSGSTGVSAMREKFNFIGIEKDRSYFEIASRRISSVESTLFSKVDLLLTPPCCDKSDKA